MKSPSAKMSKMSKRIGRIIGNMVAIIISAIVLIPLLVLFVNSFKTSAEANRMSLSLPTTWMFENYAIVLEKGKLVSSFLNGLLYAAGSVVIIVIVVSAAAFVILRNQKGVNRFLYYFIISGIAMPLYYLNNSRKWPMTLAVYNFFGAFENSWNLVAADIMLTLAPVLLIFVLGQKYIVGGVSSGAVKG